MSTIKVKDRPFYSQQLPPSLRFALPWHNFLQGHFWPLQDSSNKCLWSREKKEIKINPFNKTDIQPLHSLFLNREAFNTSEKAILQFLALKEFQLGSWICCWSVIKTRKPPKYTLLKVANGSYSRPCTKNELKQLRSLLTK